MTVNVNLRAQLAVGKNAFHPGRVCAVVEWMVNAPRRVPALIELMWDDDAGVASRASDVLERITRDPSPAMRRAIELYKEEIVGLLSDARFPKLRWNLALTIPRMTLTVPECRRVAALLETWLDDRSSIIKTTALHAMADLTRQNPESLPDTLDLLRMAGRSGTPAMRARSRILLKQLESQVQKQPHRTSLDMFG